MKNIEKQAIGIVAQLFDLAEVPVDKRQAINDVAYNYLTEQLIITNVSYWVAVKDSMPKSCDQVFVKYENGKYGINEWWESDNCWKYAFDNMIVKEWCKPPCY